jgi:hypothetical protein
MYESIAVTNAAVGFSVSTVKSNAYYIKSVVVTCEDADVRFRVDGTNPTTSEGHLLKEDQALKLTEWEHIANFKAIRDGTDDATLRCTFVRRFRNGT